MKPPKLSAWLGVFAKAETAGLLKRYPVTATGFHLIGKETERGWEQSDDISTLIPSLVRYGSDTGVADEQLRKRLLETPLALLEIRNWFESTHDRARKKRSAGTSPMITTS